MGEDKKRASVDGVSSRRPASTAEPPVTESSTTAATAPVESNKSRGNQNLDTKLSPALICTILMIWLIIGVVLGFALKSALTISIFLLPVVAYEIYRTRGESTSISSWLIGVVLILEIIFIVFGVSYNVGQYLQMDSTYIAGQDIPLGDIKILAPAMLAVFSTILFLRTAGPYTKWLGIMIFIAAFIMIYIMSPDMFKELLRSAVQRLFWYL